MNQYTFNDINVGMTETFTVEITEAMMESFMKITGDTNPLHCSDAYAKAEGHPGRVVYGMLSSSFYSTLAGIYLPGEYSLLLNVDTRMNNPVYIGDKLTITGTVFEKHEMGKLIEVKGVIRNQNKNKISSAILRISLRK